MKILIIDDDQHTRLLVRAALKHRGGFEVVEATSGAEGIAVAGSERPDGILLDGYLDDMDGIEVLARLHEDPEAARIPVVILTAATDEAEISRFVQSAARGVLRKPFDPRTLVDRVRAIFEGG